MRCEIAQKGVRLQELRGSLRSHLMAPRRPRTRRKDAAVKGGGHKVTMAVLSRELRTIHGYELEAAKKSGGESWRL